MIKNRRAALGISQRDLAEKSGVKLRTIQHYECGQRDINGASLGTLVDLSLALECDVCEILTDEKLIKKYKKMRSQ